MNIDRFYFTEAFSRNRSLLILGVFCIALLLVRITLTHSLFYLFLAWNLVLAFTPLAVSSLLSERLILLERWYFYPILLGWLLLLPNSPYLVTDFIHLKKESHVPVWFDVLLLISFSSAGILAGLASMRTMFMLLSIKFSPALSWLFMGIVCLLSGFGIYIGRFLRYNSWDVLQQPANLAADVLSIIIGDGTREALGVTFGFGCLMFLLFHLYHTPEK